ncbi:MAG: CDP-alcohol phosphatidyltransferase family protein [Candidatus Hydrogenedentota bacterium]|nr:MAG: CDP-alcohol phosphatidyltransferase family protein [Candidatus Hydrogenedentota bacterium]
MMRRSNHVPPARDVSVDSVDIAVVSANLGFESPGKIPPSEKTGARDSDPRRLRPDSRDPLEGPCGGLSLPDRLLRQLHREGVPRVLFAGPSDTLSKIRELLRRGRRPDLWPRTIEFRVARGEEKYPEPSGLGEGRKFLLLPLHAVIDSYLLRLLLSAEKSLFVSGGGTEAGVVFPGAADTTVLPVERLVHYDPSVRKTRRPILHAIRSREDIEEAERLLLSSVQKEVLDLPGRYFDPIFEDRLVRLIAPTAITPNMVTVTTTTVGFGIAAAFRRGFLRAGALATLAISTLDGVDGKLARLRIETSRLGEGEHFLDFLYENSWYIALGKRLGMPRTATAMVASDILDNLAYLTIQKTAGKMIDELSEGDRFFRLIAGRRNIYSWIFVVGFWFGRKRTILRAAAFWAAFTAAVHWIRVGMVLLATADRSTNRQV